MKRTRIRNQLTLGNLGHRVKLTDTTLKVNGTEYPLHGVRMDVEQYSAGMRGDTVHLTFTFPDGHIETWHETALRASASALHTRALKLKAALNTV